MNTTRILLTAFAGLISVGSLAFAGPDTWRRPEPFKRAETPAQCCAGKSAVCPPGGTCCEVKHSMQSGPGGRGMTRTTSVLCNSACPMPAKERGCCKTGCVH